MSDIRVAVLGAGAMGGAVAKLLARHPVDPVVVDADGDRARALVQEIGRGEAVAAGVEGDELASRLEKVDAVAAALPYRMNLVAMEAALAARRPYADLGGLYHMTLRQLELDERFRAAGVPAIVGIGAAPGITNLLAALAAKRLDSVASIDLLDAAIEPGSGFAVPYAPDTILDEFVLPAMVFEDGELREVPGASGAIRHTFPEPFGEMEAIYTLHSELATLPTTIRGVRDVRWRLALPPAVAEGFRLLVDLGLASEDPVPTSAGPVSPREVLLGALRRLPVPSGPPNDLEVAEVRATGTSAGSPATFVARAFFEPQPEGIGAGAFGTAIPIATAARWLAEGRVEPGVRPPETALDPGAFLRDLEAEGVRLETSVRTGP